MGADWYASIIIYGYEFDIPPDRTYRKFIRDVYQLQGLLEEPFVINGVLEEFHSRMEGDVDDNKDLDDMAKVIIGFNPTSLESAVELGKALANYIIDNPIFEGYDIVGDAKFHSGIEWCPEPDDDDTSDSSSDSEEDDSEDDDDGEDDEGEDNDGEDIEYEVEYDEYDDEKDSKESKESKESKKSR